MATDNVEVVYWSRPELNEEELESRMEPEKLYMLNVGLGEDQHRKYNRTGLGGVQARDC
jgi:hypothetical protein